MPRGTDFIVGTDDFTDLVARPARQNDPFHYFFDRRKNTLIKRISSWLIFECRQSLQHFSGPWPIEDRVVLANFAVPENQHTFGK
jgi:hypothetical protein